MTQDNYRALTDEWASIADTFRDVLEYSDIDVWTWWVTVQATASTLARNDRFSYEAFYRACDVPLALGEGAFREAIS